MESTNLAKGRDTLRRGKPLRDEYVSRINRVVDFIERNLGEELSLRTLANVACFSPFHFHRIFGAMMGESLHRFVQRVRIEKAAALLVSQPKRSITETAFECGFSSSAAFARAFKACFGISASEWRAGGGARCREREKASAVARPARVESGEDWGVTFRGFARETGSPQWWLPFQGRDRVPVEVQEMPTLHVAYVRHVGRYQGRVDLFARLFGTLMRWAGPRGLLCDPNVKVMAVYHDNPEITDADRLRVSACVTIPARTPVSGAVSSMTLAGGAYAVGRFRLAGHEYARAWYAMFAGWLPESGYQPDDRLCYELFHGECGSGGRPGTRRTVDICIPVRPL